MLIIDLIVKHKQHKMTARSTKQVGGKKQHKHTYPPEDFSQKDLCQRL